MDAKVNAVGTLRDEQKQIARARILQALAVEITENGLLDLSVPAVAERAGVSQRTVYNYFENKDVMVSSLGEWVEDWIVERGGPSVWTDLDTIPESLITVFSLFSEMGPLTRAVTRIRSDVARDPDIHLPRDSRSNIRTERLRAELARLRPDLDEDGVASATALFRMIVGMESWHWLAVGHGLPGAAAGRVAGWAFTELLDAFRAGRGPFTER
jgi:AcrR family transcriptional regulator